ncbi:MAG: DUF4388 domain-containing protein [Verrucomicrobiota bacterium]
MLTKPSMDIATAFWPRDDFEWLELAVESIPEISVTSIGVLENEPIKMYDLIVFDGDSPGPYFFLYLTKLVYANKVGSMLVLGGPDSVIMQAIDWQDADVLFIEKPYEVEQVKASVVAKLNDIKARAQFINSAEEISSEAQKPKSLGYLSTLKLADLVQMLCLSQWTGKIEVEYLKTGEMGYIYLNVGLLIHAEDEKYAAEKALYEMLQWGRCEFHFIEEHPLVVQTINRPWQELLLEGARRLDESQIQSVIPSLEDIEEQVV